MSIFTRDFFPGYTRAPGQTRVNLNRPTTYKSAPRKSPPPSIPQIRRTSKVTFRTSGDTTTRRRRSKSPRSPRSKIIKHISKGLKRMSPRRFKNKYAREAGEFIQAFSPLIVGVLTVTLYYKTLTE